MYNQQNMKTVGFGLSVWVFCKCASSFDCLVVVVCFLISFNGFDAVIIVRTELFVLFMVSNKCI